jgi:hypothetical protein
MKLRFVGAGLGCACLGLALSACGQSSSARPPATPTPHVVVTPVPSSLQSFASYGDPILRTSIGESAQLLQQMKHEDLYLLGNDCSLFGGDLSNSQIALRSGYAPNAVALATYQVANAGFKLVLAATDECGMAADAHSRQQMKAAMYDLWRGMNLLSSAESRLSKWQSSGA